MKKVMLTLFIGIFLMSFAIAQGQGIHEPGTGLNDPELKEAGQGTGQGLEEGEVQGLDQGRRAMVQTGNYVNQMGQQMKIERQANNQFRLEVGGVSADCPFNLTQEQFENRTRLYTRLSNGRNTEIKIMPDTASQTALQRLKLRSCDEDCQIEIREVGVGNQTRAVYEMEAQRQSRVFGLFGARMQVQAQVDTETGETVRVNKPWWAFLASEPAEE